MSELILHKITYKDIRERTYLQFEDPYRIVSFLTEHLRETLLACPNNNDDSKAAMYLMTDGNIAVGRVLEFGTKLRVEGNIVYAQTGGSSFVVESYRSQGVGASLLLATKMSKEYDYKINALFSTMIVPMLRRLKYHIFEIPQFILIRDLSPILLARGLKGVPLRVCSLLANTPIRLLDAVNKMRRKRLLRKFDVNRVDTIPDWVEGIMEKDSHKYMEWHDKAWLQWNLDFNMNGIPGDIQSFYTVTEKTGKPVGFFMTKERFERKTGNYRNIIRGTIVEWGTIDDSILDEVDINLLAAYTFTPGTFHVLTATTNNKTARSLNMMGFIRHGTLQMLIGDKKKKHKDIGDIAKWRIRYGCCNTIIFGEAPSIEDI